MKIKIFMNTIGLEKYSPGGANRYTCPQCGKRKCFTRYVYTDTGEYIDETVGKCDHESSCGYHYPPSAFFRDHPDPRRDRSLFSRSPVIHAAAPSSLMSSSHAIDTIPAEYVDRSLSDTSEFVKWLLSIFSDKDRVGKAIEDYRLGATRSGAVIFWQIDCEGRVRTGKVMHYSPDGHRQGTPTWTHSLLKQQKALPDTWQLTQCFFGQHLLIQTDKRVAIVESEKTAVILSIMKPDMLWLATGGCCNLNAYKCSVLEGRQVILFPDSGSYAKWADRMNVASGFNYVVSDAIEGEPPNTDLADIALKGLTDTMSANKADVGKPEACLYAAYETCRTHLQEELCDMPFDPWDGTECPF